MKKGMATHSSFLAGRTLWTEEPGRLQSMGLQSWTHIGAMLVWHIMTIGYRFLVLVLPVFTMISSFFFALLFMGNVLPHRHLKTNLPWNPLHLKVPRLAKLSKPRARVFLVLMPFVQVSNSLSHQEAQTKIGLHPKESGLWLR